VAESGQAKAPLLECIITPVMPDWVSDVEALAHITDLNPKIGM
jgi:hypothetical protein